MENSRTRIIGGIVVIVAFVIVLAVALVPLTKPSSENKLDTTSSGYTLHTAGVLTVTSEFDNVPFEKKDSTSYTGFSLEIAEALAERLGLTCKFTNQRVQRNQVIMLNENAADVAVSSFTAGGLNNSDEVIYTNPYFTYGLRLVVIDKTSYEYNRRVIKDAPDISSVEDLQGCTVVVAKDTPGATWAKENLDSTKTRLVYSDDEVDAMGEVKCGNADAAILSGGKAEYYTGGMYSYLKIVQNIDGDNTFCFAVGAKNQALADTINSALSDMRADGSYQEIYDKFFK